MVTANQQLYWFWQWTYDKRCSMWETLHIMKRLLLAICTCKEALLRASPMEATYVAVEGHDVWSSPGCEAWNCSYGRWSQKYAISTLCFFVHVNKIAVIHYSLLLLCQNKMLRNTKSSVSISLQRLPHYFQSWKAISWRRRHSYAYSYTQKIVKRVSFHPSRSVFVRCYSVRNSG